jgi:hypothetical protein
MIVCIVQRNIYVFSSITYTWNNNKEVLSLVFSTLLVANAAPASPRKIGHSK